MRSCTWHDDCLLQMLPPARRAVGAHLLSSHTLLCGMQLRVLLCTVLHGMVTIVQPKSRGCRKLRLSVSLQLPAAWERGCFPPSSPPSKVVRSNCV
jgi:hypothetical protein